MYSVVDGKATSLYGNMKNPDTGAVANTLYVKQDGEAKTYKVVYFLKDGESAEGYKAYQVEYEITEGLAIVIDGKTYDASGNLILS